MKVQLFSSDRDLQRRLDELEGIESIEATPALNEHSALADVLIISDSLLGVEEVREIKDKWPEKRFAYLAQNQTGAELTRSRMICATHGMHFVPPYHDTGKIVSDLARYLFPHTHDQQAGNTITFFASHPGVGLSAVVMGVADLIAKQTRSKVAVLNLNPWSPGLQDKEGKSLDALYTELKHRTLTHEMLVQSFAMRGDIHVLAGNRDMTMIYKYDPKAIAYLIERASQMFDLVLLDVGAYVDAPTSIQGMLSGDLHYLVTTQERKGLETFSRTYEQILNWLPFDASSFLLIMNKATDKITVSPKQFAGKYAIPLLQEVPAVPEASSEEIDDQILLLSEVRQAEGALQAIAAGLIDHCRLPLKQDQQKGLRHWLFGGKAVREG